MKAAAVRRGRPPHGVHAMRSALPLSVILEEQAALPLKRPAVILNWRGLLLGSIWRGLMLVSIRRGLMLGSIWRGLMLG